MTKRISPKEFKKGRQGIMKKKVFLAIVYGLAFVITAINLMFSVKEALYADIEELPPGKLVQSIPNEDGKYILNIYLVENSLGKGIRGEIVKGDDRENIYWQTGIDEAAVFWENKKTVVINSVYLDVRRGDTFDCRSDVSILQTDGHAAEEVAENSR